MGQFQPGISGNPNGRPKGRTLTGQVREFITRRSEMLLKYLDKYEAELSQAKGRTFFEAYAALMRDAFPKISDIDLNEFENLLESSNDDLLLEVRDFIKSKLDEQAANN